VKERLVAIWL